MATAKSNGNGKHVAPLIPAVPYYRASTDQQVDASIPAQRKAVQRYAAEHGYHIIREYVDEGISGWKEGREGFQRLIADLDRRDFAAVLCWDQNRFSRFPVQEANHYWYLLDRAGVHLATCNQGRLDWHSIAGWITASIKQHADSQHRFQLAADVRRGRRQCAERGEWGGKPPYGYVLDEAKRLVPHPERANIVRRIFAEYIEGHSLRAIACRLNADGILTALGCRWSSSTMLARLRNPAYVGTFVAGDIEIPGNHPAIIAPSTFATVQRLLAERQTATTPKPSGGGFLFSGLIRCGKCGSAMGGNADRARRFYMCRGAGLRGDCDLNITQQPEILEHVITALEGRYCNPRVAERLKQELYRQLRQQCQTSRPKATAKALVAAEAKLEKAKRRLVEVDTDLVPVVQDQIRTMRREVERLQSLAEASQTSPDERISEIDAKVGEALERFAKLRETLQRADTVHLRELLRQTIGRLDVWSTKRGNRFRLQRGVIHVRTDKLFNSADPSSPAPAAPPQTGQSPASYPYPA